MGVKCVLQVQKVSVLFLIKIIPLPAGRLTTGSRLDQVSIEIRLLVQMNFPEKFVPWIRIGQNG